MSAEPEAYELNRRAAAINDLLRSIGESDGSATEWWNHRAYEELGGRTPTQAWLRGDHEAVQRLVASWYAATERSAERYRNDPAFMKMLQEKSELIAEQAKRSA